MNVYSKFETELSVRPDDIDLYQHVHSTRYLDYVLAARFEQMERCYKMPMQAFAALGLGWFMSSATIHFKRPLGWGDRMVVRTWIQSFTAPGGVRDRETAHRQAGLRRTLRLLACHAGHRPGDGTSGRIPGEVFDLSACCSALPREKPCV